MCSNLYNYRLLFDQLYRLESSLQQRENMTEHKGSSITVFYKGDTLFS